MWRKVKECGFKVHEFELQSLYNVYFRTRQHPTKQQQLYDHLPPISKTIKVSPTRQAEHCWRSRDELISDVLLWTPSHGRAKARRPARTTYSSSVRIRDVTLRTCQKKWTIGRSGDREEWHDKMIRWWWRLRKLRTSLSPYRLWIW